MTDAHIFNYEEEIRLWTSPHISLNQSALAELPAVQHWEAGAAEGSGTAHSVITLDVCWAALEGPERNIAILRLIIYIFRKEVLDFLLPFHLPWLQADRCEWGAAGGWEGRWHGEPRAPGASPPQQVWGTHSSAGALCQPQLRAFSLNTPTWVPWEPLGREDLWWCIFTICTEVILKLRGNSYYLIPMLNSHGSLSSSIKKSDKQTDAEFKNQIYKYT